MPHARVQRALLTSVFFALGVLASCRPEPVPSVEATAASVSEGQEQPGPEPVRLTRHEPPASPPELVPEPLPDDPYGVTIHRLSNGLTVYLAPVPDEAIVSANLVVRAGSRNDPVGATGVANAVRTVLHNSGADELGPVDPAVQPSQSLAIRKLYKQLAHAQSASARQKILRELRRQTLLLATTSVRGDYAALAKSLGFTEMSATTLVDHTVFSATLPSNRVAQWAEKEAERLLDPVFLLSYIELEEVYRTKNAELMDAASQRTTAIRRASFPGHPLSRGSTLGRVEDLRVLGVGDMEAFFDRWYVPNNMAIVLAGEVDTSVLPVLESAFGSLEARRVPGLLTSDVQGLSGRTEREYDVISPSPRPSVTLAWQAPGLGHPDTVPLLVLQRLIHNLEVRARSGPIDDAKMREGFSQLFHREGSVLAVGVPLTGDADAASVERRFLKLIEDIQAGKTEQWQINSAKEAVPMGNRTGPGRRPQRVREMTRAYATRQPWSEACVRSRRSAAMTKADIVRVAKKYLGSDYTVLQPRSAALSQDEVLPVLDVSGVEYARVPPRAPAEPLPPAKVQPIQPKFLKIGREVQVENAPWGRLITATLPLEETFELRFLFRRGRREETFLCEAVSLWGDSGMTSRTKLQVREQLHQLRGSVNGFCTDDSVVIRVTGLDAELPEILAFTKEWLAGAVATDAQLERLIELNRRRYDMQELSVNAIMDKLLGEVFESAASTAGLLQPIDPARTSSAGLLSLAQALPKFEHDVIYSGPRSAVEVRTLIALGRGRRRVRPHRSKPRRARKAAVHVADLSALSTMVRVFFPRGRIRRSELATARVVDSYVNHVLAELDQGEGIGSHASAGLSEGKLQDQGYLWAQAQTRQPNVDSFVTEIVAALDPSQLDETKLQSAIDQVETELREERTERHKWAHSVASWADRGLKTDPRELAWQQLPRVDTKAAKALLRSFASQAPLILVVGSPRRIDMEGLERLGSVTTHQAKELFRHDLEPIRYHRTRVRKTNGLSASPAAH